MRERVLIINDCKFERVILKDMLLSMGYDVEIASEFDAFAEIDAYVPDVLICNLIMERMNGDQMIERLKQKDEQIKCVISSSNHITLEQFKEKGVDAIIHTPITKFRLQNILNNLYQQEPTQIVEEEKKVNFAFCPYCATKLDESKKGQFKCCPYCGQAF